MMKSLFRKYWYLTVVAVLFLASASFAQTTTSMDLTGVGDGATLGDVYVDPYTATVGGVAGVPVICDDWSNNSYLNETWTATVINAATVGNTSLGTPLFGNNQSLYNELAWLGSQLLANPTNTTLQTEISFAMWDLTYGVNGTGEESPTPLTYLSENLTNGTSNSEYTQTLQLISEAAGEANYNSAGWEILTPVDTDPINGGGSASDPPQEFLVYTPESSAVILFGADMIGLLGLAFVFRRRLLRPLA